MSAASRVGQESVRYANPEPLPDGADEPDRVEHPVMGGIVESMRREASDEDLAHVWPLVRRHVLANGQYPFDESGKAP